MKRVFLIALGLLALGSIEASAYTLTYEKAYSTSSSAGYRVSTGTVVQINLTAPAVVTNGNNLAGFRLQNQGTSDVWIGYNSSVSSKTAVGDSLTNLGVKLSPGANGPFAVAYDSDRKAYVPIYAIAADGAGASGVVISAEAFGYK